ncbi:threonine-phosphate decarboxylase CobD [Limnoraphis robusta]|uniref:threonine-phosphate decarboxylase n=1 Tax=Limnoraphis robusta CS-951 TaxID=1637645 RepID=A0A0F5YGJ7_9CYAN|nr:threonine-phosphate decarboxylase CobD [Limnoraphis robusta]KKD38006.1 threonine-phosphate decarboxylase [Limnoraphis robusta CS-951]
MVLAQPLARPGHGGNLTWAASIAGCSASDILDFSASINPWGPPQSALEAIQTHLSDLRAYPDPEYRTLRKALSQIHSPLEADWILPGNGAAELLTWAGWELAQQQTTYLLTPAFGDYRRSLSAFQAHVIEWPLSENEGQWSLASPGLDKRGGLLLNNPHNPTGRLFSQEVLEPYLEQFDLVVVDEAFMDFLPPQQQQSLVAKVPEYKNLVILRSLTKFYSIPGLRLGYAIAHPERLRRWQQWRDPWPVNVLAAAVGTAVVQDHAFQQYTWDWLTKARSQLLTGLGQLPGLRPYAGAANFLLVYSPQPVPELQITLLQRHRILIRDCLSFEELGQHYFRVAIRTEAENQRLLTALTDLWPSL